MDIKSLVAKHGIANLLFMAPMQRMQSIPFMPFIGFKEGDPIVVPCTITEQRYKVAEGYKISLQSTYDDFGVEHFYQSDLDSIIARGHIQVWVKPSTQD